ncbi:MAG: hypothetical protein ABI162_17150 [Luteolibacter sp.]
MKLRNFRILAIAAFLATHAFAEDKISPIVPVGGAKLEGWTGVQASPDGVELKLPGEAVFRYPEGAKGWYVDGFRPKHDGTRNWKAFHGLQLDVQVPEGRTFELQATLWTPKPEDRQEYLAQTQAVCSVNGPGWQHVTLPWAVFDFKKSHSAFLEFVQELRLTGRFVDGKPDGEVLLKNIRLVRAPVIALDSAARGKAVKAGETARYEVTLSNCTDSPQTIDLSVEKYGFEAMPTTVEPNRLQIAPGASASCVVSASVPMDGIPPGGHEKQKLLALVNGATLAELEFVTARELPRPCIQLTRDGWGAVREKVAKYDWAKKSQDDDYVKTALEWKVPDVSTPEQRASGPNGHSYVFDNAEFGKLARTAVAWQLTRDKSFAEKAALFLRRLSNEKTGYPSTFAATNMGSPQEGENFQSIAISYDAILDADVLNEDDKRAIEHTFRLFMETYETDLNVGNMGNWSVAASTASLFCALAVGDLAAADRYIHGPAGFTDYLSKGVMDDGWWWECSTGYNFWVAAELTQAALACQPWGIDLLNAGVPASYSPFAIVNPWGLKPLYGMSFEKWGPNRRNTRSIKQLWDAVPAITDYRGVVFGMNDGHEDKVGGSRMELAYHAFRDPAYTTLIRQSGKRDLIYGVPELPADNSMLYLKSGFGENLGYALLRSQTEKREPREQIQAVFKTGTQGGYHGHFDRVSLNSIMRYGRSFWSPESIWWGYGNFMYKFFVQTSVNHNMVVVDQMQQEAVPSPQLLFHSGKMMQVSAQETNARWSDPPYGGMKYDAFSSAGAVSGLAALMKKNRQSFAFVPDRKENELGPYSDRILQRRLGIVTDDYIVVADYLKAEKPHTFDNVFQMKGFKSLDGAGKKLLRHDAQFNADPHSAAQFVTDCDWYQAAAPAIGRFELDFEEGAERKIDQNEIGKLKIDIHSLWPQQQEIMLAMPPVNQDSQQWVTYEVSGDGKSLAKGESGMWVLGASEIDVPVEKLNELTLTLGTEGGKKKALFLANARLVTADGKEIPVSGQAENIEAPAKPGEDYYGGPIKIAGVPYAEAIAAQLKDSKKPATLKVSLAGKNAVRFKATLGGDYPFGDESGQRKVYSIRSKGTEARFLTVLEPYEGKAMVKSAVATGPDALRVELNDGRVQDLTIRNLSGSGKDISVEIFESKDGKHTREESSAIHE